jgi:hypothetical protein
MPISVTWDNAEQTVICLTFDGRWTWDDYHTAASEISAMLNSVNHRVDLIVDFRTSELPNNAVKQVESGSALFWHPQAGFGVLVGVKGFIRSLLMLFIQVYPNSAQWLLLAASVEDAREMLARQHQQPLLAHQLR